MVHNLSPVGFSWYENSCAYDSVLCIIYSIWMTDRSQWDESLKELNSVYLNQLLEDFKKTSKKTITVEAV